MDDEATQQATQNQFDPRRLGQNGSGLNDNDISDVICVLHPASPAAFRIVNHTAKANAQHILQNNAAGFGGAGNGFGLVTESETILINSFQDNQPLDLALRFSSSVFDPAVGFCFGRNIMKCDINLDAENKQKRVSNTHFRIYLNPQGILMIEDLSTNGTIVDHNILGGKRKQGDEIVAKGPKTRTLDSGSVIEILSDDPQAYIKFVLRIPPREGFEKEYISKFQAYMSHKAVAEQRATAARQGPHIPEAAARGLLAAPLAGPPNPKALPAMAAPSVGSEYGMHWSGGEKYKSTGILGKGAFATVYQLATRLHGELYAAKELDKKRFMKNGILDQRLDNEMQIMKELSHPNIVRYIEYIETEQYLYIIMEFVPCGDLQGYMQAHGTLPESMGREMTIQILNALAYLHKQNITHRDIKPDNILIHSEEPFVVKLTDFGLSKVVKNNETFMKTFCGTLLYCAPEVFPHFDNYVASKRPKRRRREDITPHSYSQSVDIWSYAAVLWFVLCGKPPFEGITEGNGKGMFNHIMETTLDATPLEEHGISKACIDLLCRMLNTDPIIRPNESACLNHRWLNHGTSLPEEEVDTNGLKVIEEDDEDLDASQLSLHDNSEDNTDNNNQESQGSSQGREVKRQKGESFFDHYQQTGMVESLENGSLHYIPVVNDVYQQPQRPPNQNRLFGEISQIALKSSGLLGAQVDLAAEESGSYHAQSTSEASYRGGTETEVKESAPAPTSEPVNDRFHPPQPQRADAASWRESMVRELNMSSPESFGTAPQAQEPATPKVALAGEAASSNDGAAQQDGSEEVTPRPKQSSFNRQISIPISASFFYDPYDPTTHNREYASRASGINFLDESSSNIALNSLPETVVTSFQSDSNRNQEALASTQSPDKENKPVVASDSVPDFRLKLDSNSNLGSASVSAAANQAGEFLKPPRILGKLTSTENSFVHVTLNLTQRVSTWGRNPANTFVYRDGMDTRIPKVALEIHFHAKGIEGSASNLESGQDAWDWTQMDNLNVFVGTQSKRGITINGVPLRERDEQGRKCFGKLYTGDEICVSQINEERLKFTCEFFAGKGKRSRREGSPRFIVEAAYSKVSENGVLLDEPLAPSDIGVAV